MKTRREKGKDNRYDVEERTRPERKKRAEMGRAKEGVWCNHLHCDEVRRGRGASRPQLGNVERNVAIKKKVQK
jgi:hypothetical protein